MKSTQWVLVAFAALIAITAMIFSIISVSTSPNETNVSQNDTVSNIIATNAVDASIYYFNSEAEEDATYRYDNLTEGVGSVTQITTQTDPYPGRNNILTTHSRKCVKASPLLIEFDDDDNLTIKSSEPLEYYANSLNLAGQVIAPIDIVTTGIGGDKGEEGIGGETGEQGEKGVTSTTKGNQGEKGSTGQQGPPGADSVVNGTDGEKGAQGAKGEDGSAGLDGIEYFLSRIWNSESDRTSDTDILPAGEYGLVSDDGNIYLSDGFFYTLIDNISIQYMASEKGEKGDAQAVKGEPGAKGNGGPTSTVQGEAGTKGFPGLAGTEKGEKGEQNENNVDGEIGERGMNGLTGNKGNTGIFSMADFESATQSTLSVTRGTEESQYILTVFNPVYSIPVPVWALGLSILDPIPTKEEIQNRGTLIEVVVDSERDGNANYVNGAGVVYFAYWNNTELTTVTAVESEPIFSIGGSVSGLTRGSVKLGLLIDNDTLSRETITISTDQQSFTFETLLSSGQEYNVIITDLNDIPSGELLNNNGIIGVFNVTDVELICVVDYGIPTITQYIQVNRDNEHVTLEGTFTQKANSVNVYVDDDLYAHVSLTQDSDTKDWSCVTPLPIKAFRLEVELLQNLRVVSSVSNPVEVSLTSDYPPTIQSVTADEEYDVVTGTNSAQADTLEFFTYLGQENLIEGTTTTLGLSTWTAMVPTQYPRGDHAIFCRVVFGTHKGSYSWGFSYNNELD